MCQAAPGVGVRVAFASAGVSVLAAVHAKFEDAVILPHLALGPHVCALLYCRVLYRHVCTLPQAILNSATADGHKHGVHALMLIGQHLFSGDRAGTLKVRVCERVVLV